MNPKKLPLGLSLIAFLGAVSIDAQTVKRTNPYDLRFTVKPPYTVAVNNVEFGFTSGSVIKKFRCILQSNNGLDKRTVDCVSPAKFDNLINNGYYFKVEGLDAQNRLHNQKYYHFTVNAGGNVQTPPPVVVAPKPPVVVAPPPVVVAPPPVVVQPPPVVVTPPVSQEELANLGFSNPVTNPVLGQNRTFNVGPGQEYTSPDTVPWASLVAGDAVNIFHSETPYKIKLCLRGQGTLAKPIVINGVTDSLGRRPKFDFNGAKTASGCNLGGSNNIFNLASQYSLESYGGIIIKPGANDPYLYKPKFITIQNLELGGAAYGNTFQSLDGTTKTYGDSAGIWIQPSDDITLVNNVIYDNAFGVFTMAKNGLLGEACVRTRVRNNRIYGNGRVNNWFDHNLYIQSASPIIEGNYIGQTRAGSAGSSYKSRSSGEIFRYNYVVSSARAIDLVYSEDQNQGIAIESNYGTDYVYGNIIVNDCSSGRCATNPIHYGGDNLGEQENVANVFNPTSKYRQHLFFFNNTVINNAKSTEMYRVQMFDLSLKETTVYAWNNIFHNEGTSNFHWVEFAGNVNFVGPNLVSGKNPLTAQGSVASNFSLINSQNIILGNANFSNFNSGNYKLASDSSAINKGITIPQNVLNGIGAFNFGVISESNYTPQLGSNGMINRVNNGLIDLGAFEY